MQGNLALSRLHFPLGGMASHHTPSFLSLLSSSETESLNTLIDMTLKHCFWQLWGVKGLL